MGGCACIKDTEYYSMCTPPTGAQDCSVDLLKDEVDKAQGRADDGLQALKDAKDVSTAKRKPAKDAAANLKKAKKTVHVAEAKLKEKTTRSGWSSQGQKTK